MCYKSCIANCCTNHVSISQAERRRLASRKAAKELLQDLVTGKADAYEAYGSLYGLWYGNNAAVQELRPFFRMEGIEPDGSFVVTRGEETVLALRRVFIETYGVRFPIVGQIHMRSDSDESRLGFDPVGLLIQPGQTLRWSRRGSFEQRYRGGLVGRVLPQPESGVGRARCE